MAEKLHQPHSRHEHLPAHEAAHEAQARASEKAAGQTRHEHRENLADIRKQVHEKARSAAEIKPPEEIDTVHAPSQSFVNKELKDMAYQRSLNRLRQQMSLPERIMSKVIHQPIINALSEATAKTVGRPSGILGGGLVSLIGTSAYYYITKHYGYNYNFLIFLLLLAGGFMAGWTIEILWFLVRGRRDN